MLSRYRLTIGIEEVTFKAVGTGIFMVTLGLFENLIHPGGTAPECISRHMEICSVCQRAAEILVGNQIGAGVIAL